VPHCMQRRGLLTTLAASCSLAAMRPLRAQTVRPLELGVLPNVSLRMLLTQYQPLREFLEKRLQQPVQVSSAPNWAAFFQRTAQGDYDLVVTAANMARVAQLDQAHVPLVTFTPRIKGLVIHARQRPLQRIADLRGQRLGLSNPLSLVALRGVQWLAEQGLRRDADYTTLATPADDSVGNLVVRGDCVAAMLSGGEFRAIAGEVRAQLEVLQEFAEVPAFIVLAAAKLGAARAAQLRQALLEFGAGSDEGKAFFAATGFSGLAEAGPGLLEQLDVYVPETRRLFAAAR